MALKKISKEELSTLFDYHIDTLKYLKADLNLRGFDLVRFNLRYADISFSDLLTRLAAVSLFLCGAAAIAAVAIAP